MGAGNCAGSLFWTSAGRGALVVLGLGLLAPALDELLLGVVPVVTRVVVAGVVVAGPAPAAVLGAGGGPRPVLLGPLAVVGALVFVAAAGLVHGLRPTPR